MVDDKVRNRLVILLASCPEDASADDLADRLLQSPDLRVTLVERKYKIGKCGDNWEVWGGHFRPKWGAKFQEEGDAQEYCGWLNSKEPK